MASRGKTEQGYLGNKSRYVIKVMKSNREGGEDPLVRQNQRIHHTFSLVHNLIYSIFIITYHNARQV